MTSPDTLAAAAGPRGNILRVLEIDARLLGMIGALVVIWLVFHAVTGGLYLTPRNLFNLSVQTASVAVMATGMVFVIVTRNIDLSVGSLLGLLGMIMAVTQARVLPEVVGLGHWSIVIVAILVGLVAGALIGGFQGWLVGYLTIPSFIVTLGGLLVWRGAAWWMTTGQTVAPLDPTFALLGGGAGGTLGARGSWTLAALATAAAVAMQWRSRHVKRRHGFTVKPAWAEMTLSGIFAAAIFGFAAVMVAYPVPQRAAERILERRGLPVPEGDIVMAQGIAVPVVILLAVALVMTVIAQRTRFGRYVFATGGNPEAAELSGIDTRMLTVKVFALMGALTAIAAVIASARLNAVGNDLGTLDELRTIAAAVIGGTALAGGAGTIYGAVLGALVMQSLQSGMAMVGVDAPLQSIVVGVVLVFAVWVDILYRRRTGT
jgi:D-xylose transport system permease protein